ncbi:hypothetical protein GCM10023353_31230 [Tomitella cavernea]|uniref:Transposase n=1 Tax=Tomitella cavernea TaxID=1387982 RepID=A0ABP9CXQ0_9ACTN
MRSMRARAELTFQVAKRMTVRLAEVHGRRWRPRSERAFHVRGAGKHARIA